jgi:hypothetical protein
VHGALEVLKYTIHYYKYFQGVCLSFSAVRRRLLHIACIALLLEHARLGVAA